jgi:hypothetical protein
VRAAERGEDELAGVGLARRHLHARAALVDIADGVDVAEIEPGVDAVRVEVQRDRDDVEVAGALAVAEERALDAVGAGEQAELGGGDAGAAVVVRVQRDEREVAPREVRAHPLDLVGVDVGRGVLDRGGEVEDDLVRRVGCQTSVTASQISSAKSSSVLVKLSGEYSRRSGCRRRRAGA